MESRKLILLQVFLLHVSSSSAQEGRRTNGPLLWQDDFLGTTAGGGLPDSSSWNFDVGPPGWVNGEFQEHTDSPDNAWVQDGVLSITAIRDAEAELGFTSARLTTANKVSLKYGTLEARIKIPPIQLGLWPAFWTLGKSYPQAPWPACGEMDIMEIGQQRGVAIDGVGNRRVISAGHCSHKGENAIQKGEHDAPVDLHLDFHTCRLEWTPFFIQTFVNDVRTWRMSIRREDCEDCEKFHRPHFMILNMAIGGGFTCCHYGSEAPDEPVGTKWTMEVDYVKVFANDYAIFQGPSPTVSPSPTEVATSVPSTMPPTATPTVGPNNNDVEAPSSSPADEVPVSAPSTTKPPVATATMDPNHDEEATSSTSSSSESTLTSSGDTNMDSGNGTASQGPPSLVDLASLASSSSRSRNHGWGMRMGISLFLTLASACPRMWND